jgi:hypothetical protein
MVYINMILYTKISCPQLHRQEGERLPRDEEDEEDEEEEGTCPHNPLTHFTNAENSSGRTATSKARWLSATRLRSPRSETVVVADDDVDDGNDNGVKEDEDEEVEGSSETRRGTRDLRWECAKGASEWKPSARM